MQAKRWNIKWPGSPQAWGPLTFDAAVTEREVRASVLRMERAAGYKGKRLPVGFQCWPYE